MHKLGIVSYSPLATAAYQRGIAEGVRARLGEDASLVMSVECLDRALVTGLAVSDQTDRLADVLLGAVWNLAAAGCDVAAIAGMTGHAAYRQMAQISPIPLVSMVTATRDEIVARGYRSVLLLGTQPTMARKFAKNPIVLSHVPVVVPSDVVKRWLDGENESECELGVMSQEAADHLAGIVRQGADEFARAVVAGSVSLGEAMRARGLADSHALPIPVVSAFDCHINVLVNTIVTE